MRLHIRNMNVSDSVGLFKQLHARTHTCVCVCVCVYKQPLNYKNNLLLINNAKRQRMTIEAGNLVERLLITHQVVRFIGFDENTGCYFSNISHN